MRRNWPKRLLLLAGLALAGSAGLQLMLYALPGDIGAAYAKDGGSGGDGSSGGDGGGSDDGGSDNSGSGSDSSGSGHGSGDDNSGPGSGDDDRGDDNSGSGKGRRDGAGKRDAVGRYLEVLRSHGRVASARANGGSIDVRYNDGWRETISASRYRLYDPNGRRVMERSAVRDDYRRLRAVAQ